MIYFSLVFSLNSVFAQNTELNWKAIRAFNGRSSLQDGPNCYNATFIAKGWTSIVAQTSDEEMKYYLWHFCDKAKGEPKPGDILVQNTGEDQQTEHSAAYLGDGLIFEKPSTAALYGKYAHLKKIGVFQGNVDRQSSYAIRRIKNSDYFKQNRVNYHCEPLAEITSRLSSLHQLPEYAVLQGAKILLSKLSFSRSPKKREEFKKLPEAIARVSELVDHLSGETDQDLFLYTNAESINSHFFNFQDGLRKFPKVYDYPAQKFPQIAFTAETARLDMSMRCLIARIRKARPGPETDFIVRNVPEKAYVTPLTCPQQI